LYPCDRISAEHYVGYEIGNAMIRPMSLIDYSFYEIWNSDYYLNMFEFILDDDTYTDYIPCNHCKYFKTRYCNPCPLYSLNSKVLIKSCQIAEKTLGDISGSSEGIFFANEILAFTSWPQSEGEVRNDDLFRQIVHNIPARKWGIRCVEKGEFLLLLNPYTVEYVGLTLIGRAVWESIDGKNTVEEIARQINEVAVEIKDRILARAAECELQTRLNRKMAFFFEMLHSMGFITWSSEDRS